MRSMLGVLYPIKPHGVGADLRNADVIAEDDKNIWLSCDFSVVDFFGAACFLYLSG